MSHVSLDMTEILYTALPRNRCLCHQIHLPYLPVDLETHSEAPLPQTQEKDWGEVGVQPGMTVKTGLPLKDLYNLG